MLGRFAGCAKIWSWRHPSRGVLLSLQDGELSGKSWARVLSHLEGCARCRARAAQIELECKRFAALASAEGADALPNGNDLLARIQDSIRAWSATNLTRPQAQTLSEAEARRQMEAVLEVYLGKRAAIALLQAHGVSPSTRQETLTAVDSALAALLGHRGATVVSARLRRIMDRVPESTR
jgi:hypothetical protein